MKKIITLLLLSMFAFCAHAETTQEQTGNNSCPYQNCPYQNGCVNGQGECPYASENACGCNCPAANGQVAPPCANYDCRGNAMGRRNANTGYYGGHGCHHGQMGR